MADTYTEVSSQHIIPAVENIDRLSLPSAKSLSKEERAQKLMDVGHLATRARREVKQLADHVSIEGRVLDGGCVANGLFRGGTSLCWPCLIAEVRLKMLRGINLKHVL